MSEWRYYFPEDGETTEDAEWFGKQERINDAEDAAEIACRIDFYRRDGWERGEAEFAIVVISPDGAEHRFRGWHEQTVAHNVSETTEREGDTI